MTFHKNEGKQSHAQGLQRKGSHFGLSSAFARNWPCRVLINRNLLWTSSAATAFNLNWHHPNIYITCPCQWISLARFHMHYVKFRFNHNLSHVAYLVPFQYHCRISSVTSAVTGFRPSLQPPWSSLILPIFIAGVTVPRIKVAPFPCGEVFFTAYYHYLSLFFVLRLCTTASAYISINVWSSWLRLRTTSCKSEISLICWGKI